ncbi:MAG TPA: hypothetical protein VK138_02410, partial [Acidiferrobacterales bacterium]|nr:hypothetical protein [Acidiferrobacterales bacterium]
EKLVFHQPAVRYRDVPPFFKHAKCWKNEAKQKPRFLLCVLTISPGESGRYLVAPVGRGPGMVRVKKATDGLFQQSVSP